MSDASGRGITGKPSLISCKDEEEERVLIVGRENIDSKTTEASERTSLWTWKSMPSEERKMQSAVAWLKGSSASRISTALVSESSSAGRRRFPLALMALVILQNFGSQAKASVESLRERWEPQTTSCGAQRRWTVAFQLKV